MTALGLACENVAMLIGQPWMGLFLIFCQFAPLFLIRMTLANRNAG